MLALEQQAVALDDSLPRAHSLLSFVYAGKQQYAQAIAEGEHVNVRCLEGVDLQRLTLQPFDGREWEKSRPTLDE